MDNDDPLTQVPVDHNLSKRRKTSDATLCLEKAWAKYKYLVLEHNASIYQKIRTLLKDKEQDNSRLFYALIEEAMQTPVTLGSALNAYQHVAGYFKHIASIEEKARLNTCEALLKENMENHDKIKAELWLLAQKYCQTYVLNSFYFSQNKPMNVSLITEKGQT